MLRLVDFMGLCFYCGVIYWLSDQSVIPAPLLFPYQDKLFHFIAYFIMGIFAWRNFRHFVRQPYYLMMVNLIFCSIYGMTDEWHQLFVEGRQADVFDWIADSLGGGFCAWGFYQLSRLKR
ncbi:MAG: VanZ family protein [Methylococcales bacterium]|nr:VanZ family protein [Methylococcales bacterium]